MGIKASNTAEVRLHNISSLTIFIMFCRFILTMSKFLSRTFLEVSASCTHVTVALSSHLLHRGRPGVLCGYEYTQQWPVWYGRGTVWYYEETDSKSCEQTLLLQY